MTFPNKNIYSILIVDDSQDDRFFLKRVIERFSRFIIVGEAHDGEAAIAYLVGEERFADREKYPLPDLVLLDLKMPRKTGYEVLEWLRTQSFPGLTVVVLSGSPLPVDVRASLALGAHGYWTKTAEVHQQNIIAQEIEELLDTRRAKEPALQGKSSIADNSHGHRLLAGKMLEMR